MRVFMVAALLMVLTASSSAGIGTGQSAREAHPLVGTWRWSGVNEKGKPVIRMMMTFHADGTCEGVLLENRDYLVYLGVWKATGPSKAQFTLDTMTRSGAGQGFVGSVEVSPDGQTLLNDLNGPAANETIRRVDIQLPLEHEIANALATPVP